ncbi:MAG: hypothetical protein FH762_08880 [Firmicutes bacterium]|nr:hypothetical protein [Bacillota bacterium]
MKDKAFIKEIKSKSKASSVDDNLRCCRCAFGALDSPADHFAFYFTKNDATLIDIGVQALWANGIVFLLFGFEQVYMSLFLAMGKGKLKGEDHETE